MKRLALILLLAAACPHPAPNPGQVILTCAMEEARDPKVIHAVMDALAAPDWRAKLAALVGALPGVTAEVVACVLKGLLGTLGAEPAREQQHERARTYLREHGYQVP